MSKIAIFPGSFSPFTIGHKSVVDKMLPLFDKIIIGVGTNSSKKELYDIEKRINWINSVYKENNKVETKEYVGLTVDFCIQENAKYIIRGIRDANDFTYEKKIANMNRSLNSNVETIFVLTPSNYSHISSTLIRDIIKNKGDVIRFLPKEIAKDF
tara:strand:+ start:780 stop:1244 length:465 start_codon:yes stop_codon:yes gene_type:complete